LLTLSLETEVNYCEKVWDEISAKHQEKQVVLELAKGNSSLSVVMDSRKTNISRTVKRLLNTGLLEKANGAYSFPDPLLRYWVREKILKLPTPTP
jgi:predicted transcriptional regulator